MYLREEKRAQRRDVRIAHLPLDHPISNVLVSYLTLKEGPHIRIQCTNPCLWLRPSMYICTIPVAAYIERLKLSKGNAGK